MAAITRTSADARPVNDYLSVNVVMDVATLAGQCVYIKSNGRGALANAGAAGTMKAIGVASMDCAAGRSVAVITYGRFGGWSGMTPGTTPSVAAVAGELDTVAGTVPQKIGVALSATEILIRPEI